MILIQKKENYLKCSINMINVTKFLKDNLRRINKINKNKIKKNEKINLLFDFLLHLFYFLILMNNHYFITLKI